MQVQHVEPWVVLEGLDQLTARLLQARKRAVLKVWQHWSGACHLCGGEELV